MALQTEAVARCSKPVSQVNLWTDEFFSELLQRVPPYGDAPIAHSAAAACDLMATLLLRCTL